MGHTEGNWEETEDCPKCNKTTMFSMEEYDYDKAGTCQECGTRYMIIYKKELVEVENEAFIYDGTHR